uniref:Uncharacterized protein n=1 Tax=Globodera rostochiensis TaxID=31243 RepID=A0A914IHH1_GLORO
MGLPESTDPLPSKRAAADKAQRQALTAWRTKNNTIRSSASQLKNIQIRESLTREQLEERRRLHALCTGKRTKDGQDWIVYAGSVILRSEDTSSANKCKLNRYLPQPQILSPQKTN